MKCYSSPSLPFVLALVGKFQSIYAKNAGNLTFTYLPATELVESYLQDPNGFVRFRNISSSNQSCFALFANGHAAGTNRDSGAFLVPDAGILLSTGNPEDFNGNDSDESTTDFKIKTGDEDLMSQLPNSQEDVLDPCFIQFEFQCPPETDIFTPTVNFDYVFGSDEYFEYVNSKYNDAFGFFLNGENIALLPGGTTPVTINNVNYQHNSAYFVGNELNGRNDKVSPYPNIEADGFTVELTAIAEPQPGWNTIKMVIGDVTDAMLDSWVLLEAGTFSCVKKTSSPSYSLQPSAIPTEKPSQNPTNYPTLMPTVVPTYFPSFFPSVKSSVSPSEFPSVFPTEAPSERPSNAPSDTPSFNPTNFPTDRPTVNPTGNPTENPSNLPTRNPSQIPTYLKPTLIPTYAPTTKKPTPCPHPTKSPTNDPTLTPSHTPSTLPSTSLPTLLPSTTPSFSPSYPYPCGVLPCDRAKDLRTFYSTISDPSTFDDPSSPQSLALDWITYHDTRHICPNDTNICHIIQRYVLAVFYFSTKGYQWKNCSAPKEYGCVESIAHADKHCNITVTPHYGTERIGIHHTSAWLTPVHECYWGGIACHHGKEIHSQTNCLDQIDFEDNNLNGIIPNEITALEHLRYLYLEQGNMSGTIPSFLGKLSSLRVLDLDFNQFHGTIPQSLYGLSNLRQLDINNNLLTGTISPQVGNLEKLIVFQADHNFLEGNIPVEIGNLKELEVGFFSYNNFTGSIHSDICELRTPYGKLEKLQVDCSHKGDFSPEVMCTCCSSCRQPEEVRRIMEN